MVEKTNGDAGAKWPYPEYKNQVVDCTKPVDTSRVKGQSVIITGGAGGMGEQTVRAFVAAGAYVTFGDMNQEAGAKLEAELGPLSKFIHCDVSSWESQLSMFKHAKENSPAKSIDLVVACAGITSADPIYFGQDGDDEPSKPSTKIIDVNVVGALYTLKLARFYFLKNPEGPDRDRCFVIFSSSAGYADVPGGPTYMASKFAARALMRCVRRTTIVDGIRANVIAPWYVATNLMSAGVVDYVRSRGVVFADAADAGQAILKISSEPLINGRSFTIIPKDEKAPFGYRDQEIDDYPEGSYANWQQEMLLSTSHRIKVKAEDQG